MFGGHSAPTCHTLIIGARWACSEFVTSTVQAHHIVAVQLLELYVQQHEDGLSTYPCNMSWVHPVLNGAVQDIIDPHEWNLPSHGVLDFSFSDRRPTPDAASVRPLSPLHFSVLCARLSNLSTADGTALLAPPSTAEVKAWFGTAGVCRRETACRPCCCCIRPSTLHI